MSQEINNDPVSREKVLALIESALTSTTLATATFNEILRLKMLITVLPAVAPQADSTTEVQPAPASNGLLYPDARLEYDPESVAKPALEVAGLVARIFKFVTPGWTALPDGFARDMTELLSDVYQALTTLAAQLAAAQNAHEQAQVQLAGCLIAAEGGTTDTAKQGDYGWSLAYQRTLDLQAQIAQERGLKEMYKEQRDIFKDERNTLLGQLAQAEREMLASAKSTGCYVAVREGGGPENFAASLAVSVLKLKTRAEADAKTLANTQTMIIKDIHALTEALGGVACAKPITPHEAMLEQVEIARKMRIELAGLGEVEWERDECKSYKDRVEIAERELDTDRARLHASDDVAVKNAIERDAYKESAQGAGVVIQRIKAERDATLTRAAAAEKALENLKLACSKQDSEIQQILGKALGYPQFKDDQANFPGATDADGVAVGEHIAVTLAMEAAKALAPLLAGGAA